MIVDPFLHRTCPHFQSETSIGDWGNRVASIHIDQMIQSFGQDCARKRLSFKNRTSLRFDVLLDFVLEKLLLPRSKKRSLSSLT